MMERIRVVIFEPGKPGREEFIPNTLRAMQQVVGGYIESAHLTEELVIICNEEGRLLGLPDNQFGIRGTFFIAGDDGGEELISLSDDAVMFLTGQYVAVTVAPSQSSLGDDSSPSRGSQETDAVPEVGS